MMHGREKSDSAIVAGKPTNKAVPTAAEPVERRAGAKGNASQQSTLRTQCRITRVTGAGAHTASSPSHTQGGSRVPELGPLGSVRGALSNERPYRDLANVALQTDGPNSLVFQNIFVPETFREKRERADRPLGAGLGAATVSGLIALDFQRKESVCPGSTRNE